MSNRHYLLTDDELAEIIDADVTSYAYITAALEIREYRKIYWPLGCQWLSIESAVASEPVAIAKP